MQVNMCSNEASEALGVGVTLARNFKWKMLQPGGDAALGRRCRLLVHFFLDLGPCAYSCVEGLAPLPMRRLLNDDCADDKTGNRSRWSALQS